MAERRLGLGQAKEATRASFQLAYGGLLGKKGISNVLRIEVALYRRSRQIVSCYFVFGVQSAPL